MAMIMDYRAASATLNVAPLINLINTPHDISARLGNKTDLSHPVVRVRSARFGMLEVEEDLIIAFPEGLIGFEECRRFVVVSNSEGGSFRWLQSVDKPGVAFPIVEPGEFRPDYAPTLNDADAAFLALDRETPALLFVIVTIPSRNPRAMTANLLGPLVINPLTRKGKQVVVQEEGFTTRHLLVDELARTARGTGKS